MMKSHIGLKGTLARVLAMSAFVVGVVGIVQPAQAAISATKHNLGSTGTKSNKVSDTNEICVFCHTPHGADVSTAGAPLWNKKLPAATGYTMYAVTDSLDSGTPLSSVAGVSLPCLSCHDGTQALDNVLNAPGSGGYDSTGGGANGRSWNWGTSPRVDGNGKLTGVAALGTDLSNDHPIGIKYCGGGPSYTSPGTACVDADFEAPAYGTIGSARRMWVDNGGAGRQKTDMFLFSRDFSGTNYPSVECASCHDVHTEEGLFLRMAGGNQNSQVCLACHSK